jgi:hypothetical protein
MGIRLGSSSVGLEGDVVSEGFERGDEALGGAFGVAAGEVIPAEVAVGLAGLEHVPVGGQDRVLDGASARPWARRDLRRWYWAAR